MNNLSLLILTSIIIFYGPYASPNEFTGGNNNYIFSSEEIDSSNTKAISRSITQLLFQFTPSQDPLIHYYPKWDRLIQWSSEIGPDCGAAMADPGGSLFEATDSSGHFPPESLASGHLFALGSYDRCLASASANAYCAVSIDVGWAVLGAAHNAEVRSFKRRVPLFRTVPGTRYLQGWCLPSSCTPRDAELITRIAIELVTASYNETIHEALKLREPSEAVDFYESLRVDDVVCSYVSDVNGYRQTIPISIYDSDFLANNDLNDTISISMRTRSKDLILGLSYFIPIFFTMLMAFVLDTKKYDSSSGEKKSSDKMSDSSLIRLLPPPFESFLLCFSPARNWNQLFGPTKCPTARSTGHHCSSEKFETSNGHSGIDEKLCVSGEAVIQDKIHPPPKVEGVTSQDKLSQNVLWCQLMDKLAMFHGIRTLAAIHVIYAHTSLIGLFYTLNLNDVLEARAGLDNYVWSGYPQLTYVPLVLFYSAFFAVDTFLFLSGFLAAASFSPKFAPRDRPELEGSPDQGTKHGSNKHMKRSKKSLKSLVIKVLGNIFNRLVRLTPVYASLIIFLITLAPYSGSGPFWPAPGQGGIDPTCRTHWWTNLLYVNNLIASDKMCAPWTWYLANDVQYHVILAPVLIMAFVSAKTTSVAKASAPILALLGLSIAVSAGLSYAHGFKSFAFTDEVRILDSFYDFYIKPYVRVGPFLIGLMFGCKVFCPKSLGGANETPWPNVTTKCFSWTLLATAITSIILGLCLVNVSWTTMVPFVVAFVNAIYRPVWALVLYTFVNRVLSGKGCIGRKICSFLSAPTWIPLSNLTYSAYLIHPVIMQIVFQSMRTPIYFTLTTLFIYFVAFVVITYALSLLTYLAFEMPFINLAKMITLSRVKQRV